MKTLTRFFCSLAIVAACLDISSADIRISGVDDSPQAKFAAGDVRAAAEGQVANEDWITSVISHSWLVTQDGSSCARKVCDNASGVFVQRNLLPLSSEQRNVSAQTDDRPVPLLAGTCSLRVERRCISRNTSIDEINLAIFSGGDCQRLAGRKCDRIKWQLREA